jgi:hypothetical protein
MPIDLGLYICNMEFVIQKKYGGMNDNCVCVIAIKFILGHNYIYYTYCGVLNKEN